MADSAGRTIMVQGRLVWLVGDLFQGKVKVDFNTRMPILDQQGQPVKEYGFGLAVPKSVLQQVGPGQPGEIWTAIHEEAFTLFPSRQIPPSFAMKYKDGDGLDHNGVSFAQREGHAGCLIFACTTRIPIKFFRWENGQNILINEGIKCGDYVNVQLNVKAHTATMPNGKSGMYLNPMAVQLIGFGKEIVNAPSGDSIFGNQAPPVPPGASATPIAPPGMIMPQAANPAIPATPQATSPVMPTFGGPQAAIPGMTQPVATQPHYGVLPQAHQPQMQQPVSPVPPMPQQAASPIPSYPQAGPGMPAVPQFRQ